MFRQGIFHQPYNNYAYPIAKDKLFVQLRAKKGDLEKVYIFFDDRYNSLWKENRPRYLLKMKKYTSDSLYDYFKVEIKISKKRFKYFFLVDDGKEQLYYSMYGFHPTMQHHLGHFQYTYSCEKDIYQTPDWVKKGIFYEIMVDRFYNGNRANDPEGVLPWDQDPEEPEENHDGNYYGGDIEGIIEKLDYLEGLGVTAIYLTPIFKSPSAHKYDVIDYKKVDSSFGTINIFKKLLQKAHSKGIKVVLDFIFNHTSDQFFAFQDVLENGRESKYKDWYYIKKFPVKSYWDCEEKIEAMKAKGQLVPEPNYETFADNQWNMPKVRLANPEVREYFLDVIDYWVNEIGIDGLRFDVSDEIDHYFFEQIRKFVKESDSKVYIVGETFADASPWLRGNELDGITNYRFTYTTADFFTKSIDVNAFEDRLAKIRTKYHITGQLSSLNPLSSHDLTRIATKLGENKKLLKLAMAFQMTYIGAPMIYYGDEIGMTGGEIEERRSPMEWQVNIQDEELFKWYKKLIEIRKANPALQIGDFNLVDKEVAVGIYCFTRRKDDNLLFMVFNNSQLSTELEFDLDEMDIKANKFIDLLNGYECKITDNTLYIPINSYGVSILKFLH